MRTKSLKLQEKKLLAIKFRAKFHKEPFLLAEELPGAWVLGDAALRGQRHDRRHAEDEQADDEAGERRLVVLPRHRRVVQRLVVGLHAVQLAHLVGGAPREYAPEEADEERGRGAAHVVGRRAVQHLRAAHHVGLLQAGAAGLLLAAAWLARAVVAGEGGGLAPGLVLDLLLAALVGGVARGDSRGRPGRLAGVGGPAGLVLRLVLAALVGAQLGLLVGLAGVAGVWLVVAVVELDLGHVRGVPVTHCGDVGQALNKGAIQGLVRRLANANSWEWMNLAGARILLRVRLETMKWLMMLSIRYA